MPRRPSARSSAAESAPEPGGGRGPRAARRSSPAPLAARRSAARLAAVPVAALLVLSLGGCGAARTVGGMTTPAEARIYATAADADGRIPAWIPADATGIRIKASLRGQGAILEFRSVTPADQLGCADATEDAPPPAVQDTWWPDPSPAAAMTCGDGWYAAADGELVHAWLPAGSPVPDI